MKYERTMPCSGRMLGGAEKVTLDSPVRRTVCGGLAAFLLFSALGGRGQAEELKYLALGDSFTIGELVAVDERWPVQLVKQLRGRGHLFADPYIIATTGWRTDELIEATTGDSRIVDARFDLVSLLIGVNDQYQGHDVERYGPLFRKIMKIALAHSKNGERGLIVLSIPDWGATPFGKDKAQQVKKEIDAYNSVARAICKEMGVTFFNITEISRGAAEDPALIADDGLHPSGKMYSAWVSSILDEVDARFK